jgi:circadian clock protein KaiB
MGEKNGNKLELRLYVTKKTPKAEKMIDKLRDIFKELEKDYSLEVVNIVENPELAEKEKILATPMLERKLPPPVRRIVGELSDKEEVLVGLDLDEE